MSRELENKLIKRFERRIAYKNSLSEMDYFSKDDRELKEAEEMLKLIKEYKQALIDKDNEIQKLKIDNYQQKNLINKYHTIEFPQLREDIEKLEEDVKSERYTAKMMLRERNNLQSKLDKIEEVIGNKSVLYTNSIDKIKSIKESDEE